MRKISSIAPDWWDYTTLELDSKLTEKIAAMTAEDMVKLSRPGFKVVFYNTIEEFYTAEALEYVSVWQQATASDPVGLCGPIGPTEQLPLVARIINELNISVKHGHFWSMDEWVVDGKEVADTHSLSFKKTFKELCYNRIRKELAMPEENLHFPQADTSRYKASWQQARCLIMQGGQGDVKHWAFNEPPKRGGLYKERPQTVAEYLELETRVLDLHPITVQQNSRLHCGGNVPMIPTQAVTVGPKETWETEKVSIWHAGMHDNPFGQRLTTYMISHKIPDTSVPMSVLAEHPNVQFNFYRPGLGTCSVEMH